MNIYQTYASREHDKRHLSNTKPLASPFKLRPLLGQFDIFGGHDQTVKQVSQWKSVFPNAAFFAGIDSFFGSIVTVVYKSAATSKLCTMSITKFGCNVFENLILDSSSRFWPACDNLKPEHRDSNVRKALAVTNLKNYNKLWKNKGQVPVTLQWDETNAGNLASQMKVLVGRTPEELGLELLSLGALQDHFISSTVVDVVYNNRNSPEGTKTVDENNKIVTLLGNQVNHLFDPLLEYSHKTLDYDYIPPHDPSLPMLHHNRIVGAILKELLDVQTHCTMDLVCILQDFIIPLRVDVLNASPKSTLGISKINVVFPPTIDEITRVNCIAHDALTKALHYGYMEVFKVLTIMLPYFYSAFVRHQANLSKFHSNYSKFVQHNHQYVFESKDINKGGYTVRGVETVISGSIFELPRMKLIVKRLYENIAKERAADENLANVEDTESDQLTQYYNVIMEIIDSFGYNETDAKMSKQRVFTPTGKLLTELATGWPTELQYGWMDRKVVGILELTNVLNQRSENPVKEVLVIFSDHLLFVEIEEKSNQKSVLLLPEVLMNSLINAKPLPKFSHFPNLRVKFWCDIDNLAVRSYEDGDSHFLSFTTYGTNNFRDKDACNFLNVQNYKVSSGEEPSATCQEAMDLISKAQILSKSVPFHLFKNNDAHLGSYFCAHDQVDYETEESKSPVVILLNMNLENVKEIFTFSKSAYFVYNVVLLNDHTLQLTGYSRQNMDHCEVDEIVSVDEFKGTLKESLYESFEAMFRSSFLSPVLTSSNLNFINYFIDDHKDEPEVIREPVPELKKSSNPINETGIDSYPETTIPDYKNSPDPTEPVTEEKTVKHSAPKRRKSLIHVLLTKMKKPRSPDAIKNTKSKSVLSAQKTIPDTVIPRGRKLVYGKLYTPAPQLRQSSAVSTVIETPSIVKDTPLPISGKQVVDAPVEEEKILPQALILQMKTAIENETTTPEISGLLDPNGGPQNRHVSASSNTSGITGRSLEIKPGFAFPAAGSRPEGHRIREAIQTNRNSEIPRMFPELQGSNELKIVSEMLSDIGEKLQTEKGWEKFTEGIAELVPASVKHLTSNSVAPVRPKKISEHSQKDQIDSQREYESREQDGKTPKRRVFSSQEIAMALENINASGILPEVYEKYKQYEDMPLSVFHDDGEKNWIAYIRDNSSNLQQEIRAMKEEANMDTVDVIDIGASLSMVPPAQQFDSSDATFSSIEYGAFLPDGELESSYNSVVKTSIPDYMVKLPKEDSIQSFNSDFISSFGKRLEEDFHLDSIGPSQEPTFSVDDFEATRTLVNTFSQTETATSEWASVVDDVTEEERPVIEIVEEGDNRVNPVKSTSRALNEPIRSMVTLGTPVISSSDDEYFSSNDFETAIEFYKLKGLDGEDHGTVTSSSSERTLMVNDMLNPKADPLGLRFDSVAYLSDILNGTIKF